MSNCVVGATFLYILGVADAVTPFVTYKAITGHNTRIVQLQSNKFIVVMEDDLISKLRNFSRLSLNLILAVVGTVLLKSTAVPVAYSVL